MTITFSEPVLLWIAGLAVAGIVAHLRWTYCSRAIIVATLTRLETRIHAIELHLGMADVTET